ncbi:uncharacterized protein LOC105685968 [Athalia rosae]|uniref:uncharacterized protein LOC105685968 n=1 Tax=Athalia rosae TaxID=37344 RepID=UPI0020339632|nr:uncharacterized protein LOC105685968 [Athalia rosae]XP_048516218.1 uncharacterized protein LOC105685968 [Athalia rosae]
MLKLLCKFFRFVMNSFLNFVLPDLNPSPSSTTPTSTFEIRSPTSDILRVARARECFQRKRLFYKIVEEFDNKSSLIELQQKPSGDNRSEKDPVKLYNPLDSVELFESEYQNKFANKNKAGVRAPIARQLSFYSDPTIESSGEYSKVNTCGEDSISEMNIDFMHCRSTQSSPKRESSHFEDSGFSNISTDLNLRLETISEGQMSERSNNNPSDQLSFDSCLHESDYSESCSGINEKLDMDISFSAIQSAKTNESSRENSVKHLESHGRKKFSDNITNGPDDGLQLEMCSMHDQSIPTADVCDAEFEKSTNATNTEDQQASFANQA